jgi:hypothetical protein
VLGLEESAKAWMILDAGRDGKDALWRETPEMNQ